ncbi:MAG: tRNA dimethylallyltransferase [Marmoricola sp.]
MQFGVRVERAALDERIAQRVRYMWDAGLVEEVRGLEARLRDSRTASRAIGYAQVLALLAGEITEAEAIEKTIVATRRFVRRQDAWFLKDPRVAWLEGTDLVGQALSVLERAES